MKFTVVIPCFNSANTLSTALTSLVRQSFSDFEVILVDDASDDFSLALSVVEKFKDRLLLRVIRNSSNKNGAFSRNRGVLEASGEFVGFLDADDCWVHNRLKMALEIIKTVEERRFVIYGRFELICNHSTGAMLPLRGIRKNELVSDYVFAANQLTQTSTFICPIEVAREIMFDETLTRHQDSDFLMRAQRVGVKLIFEKRKCSNYYFRAEDFRNRISTGRINSMFCNSWLNSKKELFSSASLSGYKLTIFSRILYMEGDVVQSIKTVISSLKEVGLRNFTDMLMTKLYIFYKAKLGL